MSEPLEAEERELRMALMRADLENKQADTAYKLGLLRYEPWKVFTTAVAASAALFGAIGGVIGYLLARMH